MAWRYGMLAAAIVVLALSSYLAEAFGDREGSLGPKLFYYQTAALVRPFSSRLHIKIAAVYSQTGRFGDAADELNSPPQNPKTKLLLARALVHDRRFPEAENRVNRLDQKNPSVLLLHSWALFGEGKIAQARTEYQKLESGGVGENYQQDADLLRVLLALPDTEKASHLLRPDQLESKSLKAWIDQAASYASPASRALETAELYRSLSLTRPALTTVNSVISTNPNYVPAREERFSINQELGQTQQTQKDLKILKKLNPTHIYR